jgi:DNA-directed RNA polymerase specialized sigma24 family protein
MNKQTISRRTNNEWIKQLSDPVDEEALLDLHNLLQNGLRPALKDMITKDLNLRTEEFTQLALIKIQREIPTFNGEGKFTT